MKKSKAQHWAIRRNSTKWRLLGIISVFKSSIFSPEEQQVVNRIRKDIGELLKNWSDNNESSKAKYLKGE